MVTYIWYGPLYSAYPLSMDGWTHIKAGYSGCFCNLEHLFTDLISYPNIIRVIQRRILSTAILNGGPLILKSIEQIMCLLLPQRKNITSTQRSYDKEIYF